MDRDAVRVTPDASKVYELSSTSTCEVCGDVADLVIEDDAPRYECRNERCGVVE